MSESGTYPPFPFPPERGRRTYMMDMVASDAARVPAGVRRASGKGLASPIPAEAWACEPSPGPGPRVGTLLLFVLLASDPETAGQEMRTPCREEHLVLVDVPEGSSRTDVLIGCPLLTLEELRLPTDTARWQPDARPRGLVPVLLPREGYDREPRAVASLRLPRAVFRWQAEAVLRYGDTVAALDEPYAAALREAFYGG